MQQDKRGTPLKVFWELAMMPAWIVTYFDTHLANHISHLWAYNNTCFFVGKLKQKVNMVNGLSFELPGSPQKYWQWHVIRHFPLRLLVSVIPFFSRNFLPLFKMFKIVFSIYSIHVYIYKDPSNDTMRYSKVQNLSKTFKHIQKRTLFPAKPLAASAALESSGFPRPLILRLGLSTASLCQNNQQVATISATEFYLLPHIHRSVTMRTVVNKSLACEDILGYMILYHAVSYYVISLDYLLSLLWISNQTWLSTKLTSHGAQERNQNKATGCLRPWVPLHECIAGPSECRYTLASKECAVNFLVR